ncbi:RND transporter [Klebsiella pneumoniae]|uniref:RND transporter n=1 Tax=Klebsiella pneumoniae TaxID=573 RepID=UPI0020C790ED|nr:RND transporter [Klebsiella pneumoniae]UWC85838.1 RND transporter [Klebsiella pneumoniae]
MNLKVLTTAIILVFPAIQTVHAADCTSNGLGGQFCVNDDGSTTDSIPNEVNGMDTYSSNGSWTSTQDDEVNPGEMHAQSDEAGISPNPDQINQTHNTLTRKKEDSALMGKDWHSPSNLNDGSATSSMSILDRD